MKTIKSRHQATISPLSKPFCYVELWSIVYFEALHSLSILTIAFWVLWYPNCYPFLILTVASWVPTLIIYALSSPFWLLLSGYLPWLSISSCRIFLISLSSHISMARSPSLFTAATLAFCSSKYLQLLKIGIDESQVKSTNTQITLI